MKRVVSVMLLGVLAGCSRSNLDAIGRAPGTDGGGREVADSGRDVFESGRDVADSGRDVVESGRDVAEDVRDVAEDVRDVAEDVRDVAEDVRDVADSGRDVVDSARDVADLGSGDVADSASDGAGPTTVCPSQILKPGDSIQTLTVGTTARNYLLHVPNKYDGTKAVPLILDFHAQPGSGTTERSGSPYPAVTDPEGVIMAFPSGMSGSWNVGPCCVKDADDLGFAKKVVTHVQSLACVDAKRIYAVGVAPGGGMAYLLACKAADIFAGVAPAAWDLLKDTVADCTPSRPITVVSFRGAQDWIIPYDGGYSTFVDGMPITFLGAQATFKQWAQLDNCTGSPSDPDSNGCSTYSSCAGGVSVTLCSKPSGNLEAGNPTIAWPILKQHPLP
jgi:polyhydroxybutyrate depolymerase